MVLPKSKAPSTFPLLLCPSLLMCLAIEHFSLSNLIENLVILHGLKQNLSKPSPLVTISTARHLVFQWVLTVLPFWQIFIYLIYILMNITYLILWPNLKNFTLQKKYFTFRYIDDLISINNKQFHTHISDTYPPELELKETTESTTTVLLPYLMTDIDGILTFKLFGIRDYFNFPIAKFW